MKANKCDSIWIIGSQKLNLLGDCLPASIQRGSYGALVGIYPISRLIASTEGIVGSGDNLSLKKNMEMLSNGE